MDSMDSPALVRRFNSFYLIRVLTFRFTFKDSSFLAILIFACSSLYLRSLSSLSFLFELFQFLFGTFRESEVQATAEQPSTWRPAWLIIDGHHLWLDKATRNSRCPSKCVHQMLKCSNAHLFTFSKSLSLGSAEKRKSQLKVCVQPKVLSWKVLVLA